MIFELHSSVKSRFDRYLGNGQSALLKELKLKIQKTYWNTDVGGDGQVVVVRFSDGVLFEVVPAFENSDKDINEQQNKAISSLLNGNQVYKFPVKLEVSLGLDHHLKDQYTAHKLFQDPGNITDEVRNIIKDIFEES